MKKLYKKSVITQDIITASENEHIGWMSEDSYYTQVLSLITSDVSTDVYLGPNILVSENLHSPRTKKRKRKEQFIGVGFSVLSMENFREIVKSHVVKFLNSEKKRIIWPVGFLYQQKSNAVHWNVFVYKKGNSSVCRFDPALSSNGASCYAYSKDIQEIIAECLKKTIYTVKTELPCQRDVCGVDNFCQTWILLLVDFYLHVSDPGRIKKFEQFDFYNHGKPILKSWLRCIYKQLKHGEQETWFDYTMNHFPGLFSYQDTNGKIQHAPDIDKRVCWHTLLSYLTDDAEPEK